LAYQPPASSTFLSKQTSHQQPASSTFLSQQISTSHQPPAKRTGWLFGRQGSAEIKLISEKCKLCTQTLSTGSNTNAFKSSPIKSIHHPYEKETVLYNMHAQIVTLLITSQTGVVAVWEHGLVPSSAASL
jgi:hypothetical protein